MLRLLVVLAVLGACAGFHHDEGILKKYAFLKIMTSCIGEDVIMQMKSDMMAACEHCQLQAANMTQLDFNDMVAEMRSQNEPTYIPYYVPVYIPYREPQYRPRINPYNPYRPQAHQPFAPDFNERNSRFPASTFPLQPFSGRTPNEDNGRISTSNFPTFPLSSIRRKRSLPFDVDLEKMQNAITMKVENMTCMLREMNLLTEDNQLNFSMIDSMINNLDVDYELKEDLLYVNDICKDFSMCLPVEKAKHPLVKELGQVFAYMKCKSKKAVVACMKHDVRKYKKQMVTDMKMDMGMGLDMTEINRSAEEDEELTPEEIIDQIINLTFN